jgi:hypothetical protein
VAILNARTKIDAVFLTISYEFSHANINIFNGHVMGGSWPGNQQVSLLAHQFARSGCSQVHNALAPDLPISWLARFDTHVVRSLAAACFARSNSVDLGPLFCSPIRSVGFRRGGWSPFEVRGESTRTAIGNKVTAPV